MADKARGLFIRHLNVLPTSFKLKGVERFFAKDLRLPQKRPIDLIGVPANIKRHISHGFTKLTATGRD